MRISNKCNRGMTLIEILVVLAILAMVAALLTRGVVSGREGAKLKQASIIANGALKNAIVAYISNNSSDGTYAQISAAATLLLAGANAPADFLATEGIVADANMLKDPWGNEFVIAAGTSSAATSGQPAKCEIIVKLNDISTKLKMPEIKFDLMQLV